MSRSSPSSGADPHLLAEIEALGRALASSGAEFETQHADALERYRRSISQGIHEALVELQQDVARLSGKNPLCTEILLLAADYADWLQWTFWDLPYFGIALDAPEEDFRRTVSACGLVYLSIRVIDDLVDRHLWYRGRQTTLLANLTLRHRQGDRAEGLTVLTALLLCFEGLSRLSRDLDPKAARSLRSTLDSTRKVLVGMVMEESDREQWGPEFYERMIELKNVEYSSSLYAALDPEHESPLYPFLRRYYALAQKLNDLQDYTADEARGQPNLVSIYRHRPGRAPAASIDEPPPSPPLQAVESQVGRDFLELAEAAEALPPVEGTIARLKLGESLEEARLLGLFRRPEGGGETEPGEDRPLGLSWDSNLSEILESLGPEALVEVPCPVCSETGRKMILRQQGFALNRCLECFHVYVSPRLRDDLQIRLGRELDGEEDDFLRVQRIYAEFLCRLLRDQARGDRLLDLGFGGAHLMHVARAYGFEVFGLDSSPRLVDAQSPFFGSRLETAVIGEEALPWGAFDVVVMSHVLEHLGDPRASLGRVREALNPEGLLYVAVPDLGSVQFKILGKQWNVINPLVHFQYFNQASLTRLLEDAGFEVLERVEPPPFKERVAAPWMKLMRDLGGNESGELALLARRPKQDPDATRPPDATSRED